MRSTCHSPRSVTTCGCCSKLAWSTENGAATGSTTVPCRVRSTACWRHSAAMSFQQPTAPRRARTTAAVPDVDRQLRRRLLAEFLGTALLLIAVVGSGIAAQTLSPSDTGLALLENAIATGAALVAIILAVGSVSGAHLNPVVSAADAFFGGLRPRELAAYVVAQVAGAAVGVVLGNLM